MRLYLSSYRLGNQPEALQKLVGDNKQVAVVLNAGDPWSDARAWEVECKRQCGYMRHLGFVPQLLDLRDYFGRAEALEDYLRDFGAVWVRGGNAFVLKRAYEQSGFDRIILKRLAEDSLVYSGYSAGIVLLAPNLYGIEICDDPNIVPSGYQAPFDWSGLGVLDYAILPHFESDHPESEIIGTIVPYMEERKMPYRTLRDGQAILRQGTQDRVIG